MVLLTVMVPQVTPLFESAAAGLPALTRIVVGAGEIMQRSWWLLLAIFALWWLARRLMLRPREPGR